MRTTAALLSALALSGLAGCAAHAPAAPTSAAPARVLPPPATPEEALPGIPLDGLDDAQKAVASEVAQQAFLYCGAPRTLSQSLRDGGGCQHARRMGRLVARLAGAGASREELGRLLTDYYASFDRPKRAALDVSGFGPPLGEASAKVTLVEFSDFTCPYCQLFRPALEKFVEERKERVKLFYKPFPIESHPNALEAAQAGEWARDQGIFWAMHDSLFLHPHAVSPDELVGYAVELGKDGQALREALEQGTYLVKVRASQAEARAAGLRGTPTLYFDGRRLALPDFSEWMLEFTLQDEEEWLEHRGWGRDEAR
ncbi:MAG TPA: thioredoxin domain-containing protein [Anaeromyxobacteraceae bacterium]|nr:thioredoxin domain-containing protein [Anaeromyxobacteraceae bacterium]